jgi:hypothetical protein
LSTIDQTQEQVLDSVTGFDELAIAECFGHTLADLADNNPTMFSRALVLVVARHDGGTDVEAKAAAMGMTLGGLQTYFAEESVEEVGKDEQPEPSPEASLSSVS